jgi:PAS domain S-box-containing protein
MSAPKATNELLALLLQQSPAHALILLDPQGRILGWNCGAEQIFRTPAESALGKSIAEIFTTEDRALGLDELERTVAASKEASEDDRWHVRADGSRFWGSGVLAALRDEQGALLGFGKVVRDRTELKERLETLETQVDAARTADREKAVAIAKTAHELRNVLASFSVAFDMLKGPTDDPEKRVHLVRLMTDQLTIVHRLVEDLMDAERLHSGKLTLIKQNVSLQTALRTTYEALRRRCAEKQLSFELIAPEAALWVHGDLARLQQVFTNLLDNAIKYTPARGRIWITATAEGNEAVIHFQDTGIGIPDTMLFRIFDLFTQVRAFDTSQQTGLGIGLALVRDLVELHGGSVQASSNGVGTGSTFTIRLPLAPLHSRA